MRVIGADDLPPDARVIVNGVQRARPELVVKPTLVQLDPPRLDLGLGAPTTAPATTAPATTAPATTAPATTRPASIVSR